MTQVESEIPDMTTHSREYYEALENELKKEINALLSRLSLIHIDVKKIEFSLGEQKVTGVEILNKYSHRITKPYEEYLAESKPSTLKCPSVLNFFKDSSE